jgi:chromosome segregation ATPase
VIVVMMESVAMSEHRADTPEQVLNFVPKEWPNSYGAQVEEVGQAIVTKIQTAADLSNENCDRALALAHKLSMQLRTAEDRISQLESEVELFRDRAARAERWLQTIQNEIEEKLIAPRSANAAEQTPLPKDAGL